MTLSSTMRTLLRTWYLAVPCFALSCALAGLAFALVPAHYTSTGLAMVVQPKRPGELKTANPLLAFETSLNTTAVMLSQSLNTPQSADSLGVGNGPDKYAVKNVGDTNTGGDPNQPFIYVTAQGATPQSSSYLVESVLALAGQQLAEQQRSLHVANQDSVTLATIADASTPKIAPGLSLAAAAGALCVGCALTILLCMASDRRSRARERSRQLGARRLGSGPSESLAPFTPVNGHIHVNSESNNASNPPALRP
jgi:hypothetical protein